MAAMAQQFAPEKKAPEQRANPQSAQEKKPGIKEKLHNLPQAAGVAAMISTQLIQDAFLRLQPRESMEKEMMFSNTAISVEKAANSMNTKNRAPQN